MIHPSYVDLMKVVNQGVEEGEEPVISSRYSIVMATARRARQLVAGDDPLVDDSADRKALSVAVEELNNGKIRILTDEEKAEMDARRQAEEEEARNSKNRGASSADGDAETAVEAADSLSEDDLETAGSEEPDPEEEDA